MAQTSILKNEALLIPAVYLGLGLVGVYALQVQHQNLQKTSMGPFVDDTRKLQVGVMGGAIVAAGLTWWLVTA